MHEKTGNKSEPSYEEIRDAKLELVEVLGPFASAILLDVNYGARQALNAFVLPKNVGLIVRVEASRDAGIPGEVEPGWGVENIKRMGASAVKLLVYLDIEDKEKTKTQLKFVEFIWEECQKQDILLMIEELSYPRVGEEKTSPAYLSRKSKNVLEATKLIGPYADILKLEFPVDLKALSPQATKEALGKLNEAAIRPWVLLSAGEKFEIFSQQVELAMQAGSSGYMAGRAIFNEYFEQPTTGERTKFLKTTGMERIKKLNTLVDQYATPWMDRYHLRPEDLAPAVSPQWYLGEEKPASHPAGTTTGDY